MSGPILPDDEALGPPERLHPLFLLHGLRRSLRSFGGVYALLAYLAVSGRWATALFGAAAVLAIGVVGIIVYWTRFEYRVGRHEVRIDSGILNRRHRSIPFDRIQDVDITQGLLARLFGLAEVRFETGGGGAGPNSEEGVLHTIAFDRAEEIRALVRANRSAGSAPPAAERAEAVYSMGIGRLLLAGTFNFSLALFAGLFGLTQTIGQPLGIDPFRESFWRDLFAPGSPLGQFVAAHRLGAAAAGVGLLVLLGLATGIIRTVVRDYGFRLDRTAGGLRRRRGLVTRTDVTLPVLRTQAAILAGGPVRNAFGWSDFRLQSLASEKDGKGDHVVAPLARRDEVDAILGELGWRPLPTHVGWTRVSGAYVWMRLVALSPFFLLILIEGAATVLIGPAMWEATTYGTAAAGTPIVLPTGVALVLLGTALFARWFAWRQTGYALDDDRLLVRTGWWRRRLVVLPVSRIQTIDYAETFFSRWFGVATLRFGVAGGSIRGEIIPAIPTATARHLRGELLRLSA